MTRTWLLIAALLPGTVAAQSHGPSFGLATPTLGRHGWSVDLAVMQRVNAGRHTMMSRQMLSYGITEDIQASISLPMGLHTPTGIPSARSTARMPGNPDVEILLGWRFHRRGAEVGSRVESTAWLGY